MVAYLLRKRGCVYEDLGCDYFERIKVVKLGMDTAQVLARFNNERQALAMMEHPNIAQIFDAGATRKGRSYFVMEYIEGVPITHYCDRKRMTTKERLGLFLASATRSNLRTTRVLSTGT